MTQQGSLITEEMRKAIGVESAPVVVDIEKDTIRRVADAIDDQNPLWRDEEFAKKKKEYQDANIDAIQRVVKAERENKKVTGKDAEVQAAWSKWRDEQAQYTKKVSEVREKLDNEKALAETSLTAVGRATTDVSTMDVTIVSKDITVEADVKPPSGQTAKKTLVVTIQQAVGKGADGKEKLGRWMIVGIKQPGSGQPVG